MSKPSSLIGKIKSKNYVYSLYINSEELKLIWSDADGMPIINYTPKENFSDLFTTLLNKEEVIRE